METRKIEKKYFIDKCDVCGLEIAGNSETQVKWNLQIHKQSKHKKGSEENDK